MTRDMCHHHSIGQRAEFVSTVNNLASTLLKAVEEYESKYPLDKLEKAVLADGKIGTFNGIYFIYDCLTDIRNCVKQKSILEWDRWSLDEELSCKGNNPHPLKVPFSLLFSFFSFLSFCSFPLLNFSIHY